MRYALAAGGQRDWPGRYNASTKRKWSATLAAATLAAAIWASEAWNSIVASSRGRSDGGHGCPHADGNLPQTVQQQDRQQRYLHMQQAAFFLSKAVQLLLPPAAIGSLDALEQEPVPELLTALAAVCTISPDALDHYLQVRSGPMFSANAVLGGQHFLYICHHMYGAYATSCLVMCSAWWTRRQLMLCAACQARAKELGPSLLGSKTSQHDDCMRDLRAAAAVLETAVETVVDAADDEALRPPSKRLVIVCCSALRSLSGARGCLGGLVSMCSMRTCVLAVSAGSTCCAWCTCLQGGADLPSEVTCPSAQRQLHQYPSVCRALCLQA